MNIIFDAHCDTISELMRTDQPLSCNTLQLDLERMQKYDTYIQVFAAFVDRKNIRTTPMKHCLELIEKYHSELEKNKNKIKPILTASDLKDMGGVHSILAIEGGEALEGSIAAIKLFYDAGVRLITLTWNYANEIADGITESRGGGLTEFGKAAVTAMEDIGILIDVSHLSEQGFWDVVEHTRYPFVASHSCAKALCSNPRNLSDLQISAIADRRGCIGVNFYTGFLSDSDNCGLRDIFRHIEYMLAIGGGDAVGFGSDFDGVMSLPDGIKGVEDMTELIRLMEKNGLSVEIAEKVAYKNFHRIFLETLSRSIKTC